MVQDIGANASQLGRASQGRRGSGGQLRTISAFTFIIFMIAGAFFYGAPALLNAVTRQDAIFMALNWAGNLSEEFDLPGEPVIEHEQALFGFAGFLLAQNTGTPSGEADLFNPAEFEKQNHIASISGFIVFTHLGDRFVRGGEPLYRDLENPIYREGFDRALAEKRAVAIFDYDTRQDFDRYIHVYVPLYNEGRPRGVIVIDVLRSNYEAAIYSSLRLFAILMAFSVTLVGLAFIWILSRWSEAKNSAEAEAVFLAFYDPLTGLANRRQHNDRFPQMIKDAAGRNHGLAVLCFDLDNFKGVNDFHGHSAGDTALKVAAARISSIMSEKDLVTRLSGDEFVAVLDLSDRGRDVDEICSAITRSIAEPMKHGPLQLNVTCSIGIALCPRDGKDPETLLAAADMALYEAKAQGRNRHVFFDKTIRERANKKREIQHALLPALKNGEFELWYQPQVDVVRQELLGFEALMRWRHPEKGIVGPDEFIPAAEETRTIDKLGLFALEKACETANQWPDPYFVSVNVSAAQFRNTDIVEAVKSTLKRWPIRPERLELEITESVLMTSDDESIRDLEKIRDLGIGIALDDFGTGFSSLSYLTQIPITKIKIDRSFTVQMESDVKVQAVVAAILELADKLSLKVTAEGVETMSQSNTLRHAGCSVIQGYLYGRPAPDPLKDLMATKELNRAGSDVNQLSRAV